MSKRRNRNATAPVTSTESAPTHNEGNAMTAAPEVQTEVELVYTIKPWCPAARAMGVGPFTRREIEAKGWNFKLMNLRNHVEVSDVRDGG